MFALKMMWKGVSLWNVLEVILNGWNLGLSRLGSAFKKLNEAE
jgi:hypothetical protein